MTSTIGTNRQRCTLEALAEYDDVSSRNMRGIGGVLNPGEVHGPIALKRLALDQRAN